MALDQESSLANGLEDPLTPSKPIDLRSITRTDETGKAIRNVMLLSLPDDEFALFHPELEPIDLPRHFILHEADQKIPFAYFLNDGMTSMVALSRDGRSVEVGIIGREGMVGIPLTVGLQRGSFRAITQIPGSGFRIKAETVTALLPSAPALRSALAHYAVVNGLQVAQIAACNRLHEIEQRLARWLLMCQDRVDSEILPLTHGFLAQMLGTGRPSVSIAIGILHDAGTVENARGAVRIVNRNQLETVACECYDVIRNFNGGLGLR